MPVGTLFGKSAPAGSSRPRGNPGKGMIRVIRTSRVHQFKMEYHIIRLHTAGINEMFCAEFWITARYVLRIRLCCTGRPAAFSVPEIRRPPRTRPSIHPAFRNTDGIIRRTRTIPARINDPAHKCMRRRINTFFPHAARHAFTDGPAFFSGAFLIIGTVHIAGTFVFFFERGYCFGHVFAEIFQPSQLVEACDGKNAESFNGCEEER